MKIIKIKGLEINVTPHFGGGYRAWITLEKLIGRGETEISACSDLLDKYSDALQTALIAEFQQ